MRRAPLLVLAIAACTKTSATTAPPPPADEDPPPTELGASVEGEGDDPTAPPAPSHVAGGLLGEGERELAAMRSSSYSYRTDVDESAGRFDYDCSGFVSYAMARALPASYAAVRAFATRRPRARDFVGWIAALGSASRAGWSRVPDVLHLAPGDIVAWRKPEALVSKNTGHVMIVDGPPHARSDREWIVPILDSTASAHGPNDTRAPAGANGLGRGTMILVVDGAGVPVAYRWSERKHSKLYETEIALGRVAGP
jgi:hypothetical protein